MQAVAVVAGIHRRLLEMAAPEELAVVVLVAILEATTELLEPLILAVAVVAREEFSRPRAALTRVAMAVPVL
jgi:hypothetical protein